MAVKKFPQQNLKSEEKDLMSVAYKGLQVHKAEWSCIGVLHISRACLDYALEACHLPLVSPAQNGR